MVASNDCGLSVDEIVKRVKSGDGLMAISPSVFNRLGIRPHSDKWNALFTLLINNLNSSGGKAIKVRILSSKQKKEHFDCYVFWSNDQLLVVETLADCIKNGNMEFVKIAESRCGNIAGGDA